MPGYLFGQCIVMRVVQQSVARGGDLKDRPFALLQWCGEIWEVTHANNAHIGERTCDGAAQQFIGGGSGVGWVFGKMPKRL